MLPDELFVSLIDTDLQERIAMAGDLDGNAAEALKFLLESAPTAMTTGLEDWTLEEVNGQNVLFYKGKNYIPRDTELQRDIVRKFHVQKLQGTQEKLQLTMLCDNTTGGLDLEHL